MSIPGAASPLFIGAAAGAAAAYQIDRSLRFDVSSSSYLNRTPSSAGNRRTYTFSTWLKRANLVDGFLLSVGSFGILFENNELQISFTIGSAGGTHTDMLFRDPSAWYHLVIAVDTTQFTAADRVKLYVNGTQITSFRTTNYPSQGSDTPVNDTASHSIGRKDAGGGASFFDGYLAETHFIDGVSGLTASDFGEFDSNSVWQPKEYSGSYGTNGFKLDFSDNTSTTTISEDSSGNNNDWTANNISVASGAGNDSLIDTPTNYDDGTNVGGNYATLNPLDKSSSLTVSNGNLEADTTGGWDSVRATFGMSSGKYYWETQNKQTAGALIGIALNTAAHGVLGTVADGAWTWAGANVYINGTASGTGLSNHSSSDIVQYALDVDAGKLWFGRNGTWYNSSWGTTGNPATGANPTVSGLSTTSTYFAAVALIGAGVVYNFGARSFSYTPPTGYKSLCTTNLLDPTIADGSTAMDIVLYTGTRANQVLTFGMQPDFVWAKNRSTAAYNHVLTDSVRGASKVIFSNLTNAEQTSNSIIDWDYGTNQVQLGDYGQSSETGDSYVAWAWDAGTSTVSNTDGSITSQVRANPSAGFSIVSYNGDNNAGDTVGHGLNAAPKLILIKNRDAAFTWYVYHSAVGATKYMRLDTVNAETTASGAFNNTAPTSSVFSLGQDNAVNDGNKNYIAYCFAPVDQYSSFGSFQGNGLADGPFVYTGHRNRFIMIKRTDGSAPWVMVDTARNTYNVMDNHLLANDDAVENGSTIGNICDSLSNGFKMRGSDGWFNNSGANYLYVSFAEHPFKTARAR